MRSQRWTLGGFAAAVVAVTAVVADVAPAGQVEVGFAKAEVTPRVDGDRPVWLAGYSFGRRATGVHDPLYARAVVLRDPRPRKQGSPKQGGGMVAASKIALVSVDSIGLMRPTTQAIRAKLADFDFVVVASTHDHEGPDAIGLWGQTPLQTGVDPDYLKLVVEGAVKAVRDAEKALAPAEARYGTAADETLLNDSRQPIVKDGVLRVLRFDPPAKAGRPRIPGAGLPGAGAGLPGAGAGFPGAGAGFPGAIGLLVQWNCHPESLGSKNTQVTADFPAFAIAALEKRYGCPVTYFSGAVGGLMGPPHGVVKDEQGGELRGGNFEYAHAYGELVAALAGRAIDGAKPIELAPMHVTSRSVTIPLGNLLYLLAGRGGVIQRDMYLWTGDPAKRGRPFDPQDAVTPEHRPALETEVAHLRLGELQVACIPGELYPELVYGHVEDPPQPGADYPDAPPEPSVMASLRRAAAAKDGEPDPPALILGLANDEIGYLIPKRQWDQVPPYAYGRSTGQYGEINSVGPEAAGNVMAALRECVTRGER
jgi:hypothetical protein